MSNTGCSELKNIQNVCKKGIGGLCGSSVSLAISEIFSDLVKSSIIVCKDNNEASEILSQLRFFSAVNEDQIIHIPEIEVLPYDTESPNASVSALRISAFNKLASMNGDKRLVVTTAAAATQYIMDFDYWINTQINLKVNEQVSIQQVEEKLIAVGYEKANLEVTKPGEFTVINNILDVYPLSHDKPARIAVSDSDHITSIKTFDSITQKSIATLESIQIFQAREVPLDKPSSILFRKNFRKEFSSATGDVTYSQISAGETPEGIEFYTYLYDKHTTLMEKLSERQFNVFLTSGFSSHYSQVISTAKERYEELKDDKKRKILPPQKVWLNSESLIDCISRTNSIFLSENKKGFDTVYDTENTGFSKKHSLSDIMSMLSPYVKKAEKVVFVLHSEARSDQIVAISRLLRMKSLFAKKWDEAKNAPEKAVIVYSNVNTGYFDNTHKILVVTEKEIFGMPIQAKIEDESEVIDEDNNHQFIKDLEIDDLVVHTHFGIGKYKGLKQLSLETDGNEYFTIEYQDSALAFVQISDLHLVNKYNGLNPESVKIDRLDEKGSSWKDEIAKVVDDIEGTALTLIEAQIQREKMVGIQIPEPKSDYYRFCREFPYQATNDQLKAVEDIKNDLVSSRPMDRLVAGDVGFGKTEVALRASMIVASAGAQVVLVAPSTILAQQHYRSFKARFESFGINVVELTSGTQKIEKEIIQQIESGEAHIIIGTHKAIKRAIDYHNLALVIIDEEHRFGVNDKENIRSRFSGINILAMTATPIPRTLNMSLSGIKDTSTLRQPPANRLNIRTIVSEFNDQLIVEAIKREMLRNGQLFFLHNNTTSIYARAEYLKNLFPDLRIGIAHGKMHALEVEAVMSAFYKHEFDMLIATTIIENGIDVPNANTILIENANAFGLAALHQLRGRVGRSTRQGYAYLLTSGNNITEEGMKRLNAMEKTSKIGEGYKLANHDLEIRGAGEILGENQSGHISKMGYSLYHYILNKCIEILKSNNFESLSDFQLQSLKEGDESINIDVGVKYSIPESYIPHPNLRLYYYRRISMAEKVSEVNDVFQEMEDRFGKSPYLVGNLIFITKLKMAAKRLKIVGIHANEDGGKIIFSRSVKDRDAILNIFVKDPENMQISAVQGEKAMIHFNKKLPNTKDRVGYIRKILL